MRSVWFSVCREVHGNGLFAFVRKQGPTGIRHQPVPSFTSRLLRTQTSIPVTFTPFSPAANSPFSTPNPHNSNRHHDHHSPSPTLSPYHLFLDWEMQTGNTSLIPSSHLQINVPHLQIRSALLAPRIVESYLQWHWQSLVQAQRAMSSLSGFLQAAMPLIVTLYGISS